MDDLVAVTPDPKAGTWDEPDGGDMFAQDAKMAESHGGDAGGVTFPLIDGEQVLKAWHAPTSDSVFQLSRNNLCLVKTNKRVGYTAEKVQPCCPDKILFARQMQSFEPDTIATVRVNKSPYDVPLLLKGILSLFVGIGVLAANIEGVSGPVGGLLLVVGLLLIAVFIIKAKNAVPTVELTTSIETHAVWGCFTGTEQLYMDVESAGTGQLQMGAEDDVGKQLLLPAGTSETTVGEWKNMDPKNPNIRTNFIVTDCRLVYRTYMKTCCMVVDDSILTINPEQVQSICLDSAPLTVGTFYGTLIAFLLGLVVLIVGASMPNDIVLYVGIFVAVVGFINFATNFCKRPQDALNIYLKTAVFSPTALAGSQQIGPILIPTGDGKAALKCACRTLDSAVKAARARRRGTA